MTDKTFNIVFDGELVKGVNEAAVKTNVGKLFALNEKQLEAIFSGKRIVLKKHVDSATAIGYRGKLKQAGIVTAIEPVANEAAGIDSRPQKAKIEAPNQGISAEHGSAIFKDKSEDSDWSIAPVGVQMSEGVAKPKIPAAPDIGHISVAPVGSDILTEKNKVIPVEVDISNLSIVPED